MTPAATPAMLHFSAATLEAAPTSVTMFKAGVGSPKFSKNKDGTSTLKGIRVFKEGTFKDSMGFQRTWEALHLEQMVNHFNLLKSNKLLQDVPVREGHPSIFGSGGDVVGYITELRHEKGFLVADLEFTEPDATGKWERGTYRARSLEVGMYESNAEAAFWPVVFGLAFVDIGAVEGLYEKHQQQNMHFSQVLVDDKEAPVGEENNQPTGDGSGEGTPPPAPSQPATPPAPSPAPAPDPAPAPVEPTGSTPPASNNQNPSAAASVFSINGRQVNDPAQVQAHITALESFAKETQDTNRKAFVEGLATAGKITATQVDSLTAHALSLSAEQYTTFAASYEAAAPVGVLRLHGVQGGGTPPAAANGGQTTPAEQIAILEETIAMHRRSGMSEEKLTQTDSFKKLQTLRQTMASA